MSLRLKKTNFFLIGEKIKLIGITEKSYPSLQNKTIQILDETKNSFVFKNELGVLKRVLKNKIQFEYKNNNYYGKLFMKRVEQRLKGEK